jgi:hypothetical protein
VLGEVDGQQLDVRDEDARDLGPGERRGNLADRARTDDDRGAGCMRGA